MRVSKNIILFLGIVLIVACFQLEAFSQAAGAGGLGSSISTNLGGLVNSNVFNRIGKPKVKPRVKTSVSKTKKPINQTVAETKSTKASKSTVSKSTKTAKTKVRPVSQGNNTGDEDIASDEEEDTRLDSSILSFSPIADTGIDIGLAKSFTTNKAEQDTFMLIFRTVKTEYDKEAAKKGRKNDIAMALTFFIITTSVVYHDSPEPSDETVEKVYQVLADSMIENGEFSNFSDLDKQSMSDRLVYISGVVLFGYTVGKQTNDKATKDIYRSLAGICLQSLMKVDPNKVRIDKNGLSFSS
jgi:hypothetical protein